MLYSMTGYGKSAIQLGDKSYVIEIKTLNSKSLDLNFKVVSDLRSKEIELRKLIAAYLIRGKVDLYFQEDKSTGLSANLNFNLIENYYQQLTRFAKEKNISSGELLPAILRFQDVNKAELAELNETDFTALFNAIEMALNSVNKFRQDEGGQLEKDLRERINSIQQHKVSLLPFEEARVKKVKEKLQQELNNYVPSEAVDKHRFEEELIYYLEKMDINEEKVRLESHCNYFLETIEEKQIEKGKNSDS